MFVIKRPVWGKSTIQCRKRTISFRYWDFVMWRLAIVKASLSLPFYRFPYAVLNIATFAFFCPKNTVKILTNWDKSVDMVSIWVALSRKPEKPFDNCIKICVYWIYNNFTIGDSTRCFNLFRCSFHWPNRFSRMLYNSRLAEKQARILEKPKQRPFRVQLGLDCR